MTLTRRTGALVAFAALAMGSSVLTEMQFGMRSAGHCPECNGIYYSLLKPHLGDDHWLRTHALLNSADGSRFIVSSVVEMRLKLNWFDRLRYRCEINSFLKQEDGGPLLYTAGSPGLRLISPSDRKDTLKGGVTLLTFTSPGISCDGREAMVYVITETQDSPLIAPYFSGSLIYLKKSGNSWAIDHPKGLPGIIVVS